MRQFDVTALGELLIDFTESGLSPQGNILLEANPGGAPCNVLAMLEKLGQKTAFIGKVGQDAFGHHLKEVVETAGIDTRNLLMDEMVHTTLAFVHKKPDGDRDFSFYRNPGADMMLRAEEIKEDLIADTRLFHFGSLSLTHPAVREATKKALALAEKHGCLISFDPNLREPLWNSLDEAREQIAFGMEHCHILKISDNELQWFSGKEDFDEGIAFLGECYRIPLILLILFLAGYLAVGGFGHPDLIISGILFGGSLFVFVILLIMRRITEHIREHEQLRYQLEQARQANTAKTFFLSNMSHDIRTPMNAIIGYTNLASQEETDMEQMRGYMDRIHSSSTYLLELINDILEMSRIESGKITLLEQPEDLEDILEETHRLFEHQMQEKHLDFRVQADLADPYVVCDRRAVNRILLNLISNAWKFTPEGGRVEVALRQLPDPVQTPDSAGLMQRQAAYELTVSDTGMGMSEEFAGKIFEAFERERTSTDSGIQGTGLGMAITKHLVDQMGGTIDLETAQGKGTCFTVRLQMQVAAQEEIAKAGGQAGETCFGAKGSGPAAEEIRDLAGMHVLLVEDVEINREIATRLLSAMGVETETAVNGRQALEKVQDEDSGAFDVILMDIQMPEMDGYEACRAIRALPDPMRAGTPIIALTANAFAEDLLKAEEAGMNGHVAKPIDPKRLEDVLAEYA